MITKLWGALMLKLARLIVAIKNAFHKNKPSESDAYETTLTIDLTLTDAEIKSICQSHSYCEQCDFDTENGCTVADDDEDIPCYWRIDERTI